MLYLLFNLTISEHQIRRINMKKLTLLLSILTILTGCNEKTIEKHFQDSSVRKVDEIKTFKNLKSFSFVAEFELSEYINKFKVENDLHSCTFYYKMSSKSKLVPPEYLFNIIEEKYSRPSYNELVYKAKFSNKGQLNSMNCNFDYETMLNSDWQTEMELLLKEDRKFISQIKPSFAVIKEIDLKEEIVIKATEKKVEFNSELGNCTFIVKPSLFDRTLNSFKFRFYKIEKQIYNYSDFRYRFTGHLTKGPFGAKTLECHLNHVSVRSSTDIEVINKIINPR